MKRRQLTDGKERQLREKWQLCYICETPPEGYDANEIEYDHIYGYAEGYS